MMPTPILFLSDAPELSTGLGRIGRDLACVLSRYPQYRVGFLGLGGHGSRQLPFVQYSIQRTAGEWGQGMIERVWNDFAGREHGIVFSIWDASRLFWLARPEFLDDCPVKRFLQDGHFDKWGYFPIDSTGPGDRLTSLSRDTLLGFDRILAYTKWADGLIRRSIGDHEAQRRGLDWIPHGINMNIFQSIPRTEARRFLSPRLYDRDVVIGCVGTNQARKDWGLAFAAIAHLRSKVRNLKFWVHIDLAERYWSLPALVSDYGLGDCIVVTHEMSDRDMAKAYSACNVTMHVGLGEGFGFPIAESLSCGVPVVFGNYSGAASVFGDSNVTMVNPVAFRLDTLHNCLRPVYEPGDFSSALEQTISSGPDAEGCRASVSFLDWKNLWPVWETWFGVSHA